MNEVDDKVVPFELARLLRDMGYDERIREHWQHTYGGCYPSHYGAFVHLSNTEWKERTNEFAKALRFDGKHPPISAPSYAMVVDWLLKEYDYFVQVVRTGRNEYRFEVVSFCVEEGLRYSNNRKYTDRYSAMDVAFKYILRVIKDRQKSDVLKEAIELLEKEKEKKDGQAKND